MIYRTLAKLYKYTPQEIAAMTPYQQIMMLGGDDDDPDDNIMHFDDWEDYQTWLRESGKDG